MAVVPHHRHSWRLHDILIILVGHGIALEAGAALVAVFYILMSVALSLIGIFGGLALICTMN